MIRSDRASNIATVPFEYILTPAEPVPSSIPGRININTPSLEELQEILHIVPARADEIIS